MANQPPSNIVQLIQSLRTKADAIDAWIAAGNVWPGPTSAAVRATATTLETQNNLTEASYSAYRVNKDTRDTLRADDAVPQFRSIVQAAYLVMGKDSANLLAFDMEPLAAPAPSQVPAPPAGLDVREVSATSVLVDWDPVIGAERYHVYAGTALNAMQLRGSATASELAVGGLTEGTKYFFHVTSVNPAGESQPSNFTSRTTL